MRARNQDRQGYLQDRRAGDTAGMAQERAVRRRDNADIHKDRLHDLGPVGRLIHEPVEGRLYTLHLYAWNSTNPVPAANRAMATPSVVELRAGNASGVNLTLE